MQLDAMPLTIALAHGERNRSRLRAIPMAGNHPTSSVGLSHFPQLWGESDRFYPKARVSHRLQLFITLSDSDVIRGWYEICYQLCEGRDGQRGMVRPSDR